MIRIQVKPMLCLGEFLGKSKMKKKENIVGVSILSSDFFDIKNTMKKINFSDVDFVHLDVMDGVFVPNISFGPHFISSVRLHSKKVFDVHLMVKNPYPYICDFVNCGADIVTVHIEAKNAMKSLKLLKNLNKKCGIVINPETSYKKVRRFLGIVDVVMVMTVHPGFGGQKFMEDQLLKISNIATMIKKCGRDILLEVDGGINDKTLKMAKKSGANAFVVGSYLFNQPDFAVAVSNLKKV